MKGGTLNLLEGIWRGGFVGRIGHHYAQHAPRSSPSSNRFRKVIKYVRSRPSSESVCYTLEALYRGDWFSGHDEVTKRCSGVGVIVGILRRDFELGNGMAYRGL